MTWGRNVAEVDFHGAAIGEPYYPTNTATIFNQMACLMTFRAEKARRTAERGWCPLVSGEGRIGSTLTV